MWTDERLIADLTEGGTIPLHMFFLSSHDGSKDSLAPGYWQVRDRELVPMGWLIDNSEWGEAVCNLLCRLGVPRFMSIQEEEAARLKKERELFPEKSKSRGA